ncbi:hypothetical protein KC19_1G057900 [Ceratodon purpureus]|uniref:Uncharacterized protein n=1 Tax=Ceratodon purpureus TaxID=3225 RepID=A0A8T0J571_CERPU|nr:hypothetical protein KC19_1G057900 [Ceratodon purpureus]
MLNTRILPIQSRSPHIHRCKKKPCTSSPNQLSSFSTSHQLPIQLSPKHKKTNSLRASHAIALSQRNRTQPHPMPGTLLARNPNSQPSLISHDIHTTSKTSPIPPSPQHTIHSMLKIAPTLTPTLTSPP